MTPSVFVYPRNLKLILLFSAIWLFCLARPVKADITVNEVMSNPQATSDASEWVELFNYNWHPVEVNRYKLNGQAILPESQSFILQPGSFLLLTKNKSAFVTEFGEQPNLIEFPLSLNNQGGEVVITASETSDTFKFGIGKSGQSFERAGPICKDLISVAAAHSVGKQNSNYNTECFAQTPQIIDDKIQLSKDNRTWVTSVNTVGTTTLHFQTDATGGKWLNELGEEITNPASFSNFIGKVYYAVTKDGADFIYRSKEFAVLPNLQITEIYPDPSGSDAGTEWIEIFNPESTTLNLTAAELKVGSATHNLSQLALAPQQYWQVVLPAEMLPNCNNQPGCTVNVELWWNNRLLTTVSYTETLPAYSYAKLADKWQLTINPTPGKANVANTAWATLQFSEIYPNPDANQAEWIELYNFGDTELDITNWYIADASSKHLLSNLKIAPRSYVLIDNLKITLNNSGDVLKLFNPAGQPVDVWEFTTTTKAESLNRTLKNGKYTIPIYSLDAATPGKENESPVVVTSASNSASSTATTTTNSTKSQPTSQQILGAASSPIYSLPNLEVNRPNVNSNASPQIPKWQLLEPIIVFGGVVLLGVVPSGILIQRIMRRIRYWQLSKIPEFMQRLKLHASNW
jgi:P pilus assembly chaperone PapD